MAETSQTEKPRRPLRHRILKWSGITVGTLIVLLVAAVFIIPHLVNLGPVKHEIEHVASTRSGRTVTIDGPLSLSLLPWVGFDARDVTMANATGFRNKPFLHANELEVHVKLIPLIFHDVQISGVTLDRLTLNLERNKNGRGNWQDLTGQTAPGTKQTATPKGGGLKSLSVQRIAVNGARVDYTDAQTGRDYTLSGVDLSAHDIAPGQPFPLHLKVDFNSRQPHVSGSVSLDARAQFDARADQMALDNAKLTTHVAGGGLARPLDLDAQWEKLAVNLGRGTAQLSALHASTAGLTANVDATAQGLETTPSLQGRLELPGFSPRKVLAKIGQPVPTTLRGFDKASLKTDFRAGGKVLALSGMTLHLDDTTLTGRLAAAPRAGGPVTFDLRADRLDLDRYLPAGAGKAAPAAAGHSRKFLETRLPGRLLKKLDVDGHLTVASLKGLGLAAQNVALTVKGSGGKVVLAPVSANLYGGGYSGTVRLATAGEGISLDTTQKLRGVAAGKIITALGGGSRLSGNTDAAVSLRGSGATVAELLDTLKGQATFALHNGALDGVNLWGQLERAYALVKDHKNVPVTGPKRTEFANLEGSASIDHGVITNDALTADLPFLSVTGHGRVDLNKRYLSYDLLTKVVKTPKTAGGNLAGLTGATIPVHVSGGFGDFQTVPDMKAALQERAKAELAKKLDAQKKSARDKLKQKLQDLLNSGGGGGG